MGYNFLDGSGGYNFDLLSLEVKKFDSRDTYGYNKTYITARGNIDWLNLGADINQKIQFLSDWNTTIVRANKSLYSEKFKEVAENDPLNEILTKYKSIELVNIKFADDTPNDIIFIYDTLDYILGPTSASKVLHMYNPNLFPIWDDYMRKNFFHFKLHKPYQYLRLIQLMRDELILILDNLCKSESLNRIQAIALIKELDKPTFSLLRILDKVNYNNSRKPITIDDRTTSKTSNYKGGNTMAIVLSGRESTGLNLSDFLNKILPLISTFSMNKAGGYTYEEERLLWQEGKMTAAFLKKVASMLDYQTFQSSNYDLLNSLKRDKEALIKVLKEKPYLDKEIILKSKGSGKGGTLKSGLLI
jgi:hypothetical protein